MQLTTTSRFSVTLTALASLQFFLFIVYFPFSIIVTPYGDSLDWLAQFYAFPEQSLWQYLWTLHNGHRIIFTKLLIIGDAEFLGGLSYPVALICMFLWTSAIAIAIRGIRGSAANPDSRTWITALMVIMLFPTYSFPNLAYPVNSAFVIASFFVFLACALLACAASNKTEQTWGYNIYFLGSLMAATFASTSAMNGLIIWPILLWAAWALNFRRIYIVTLFAIGLLIGCLFAYSHSASNNAVPSITSLGDITHIFRYLVEYHGMPWVDVRQLYWPSMILGSTIFFLSIVFTLKGLLALRKLASHDVVAIAMLLFTLSTAVMIAIGRYRLGLMPAHRYGIFLLISCGALLALNIQHFENWMGNARGRVILKVTILFIAIGYLGQQVAVGQYSMKRAEIFAQFEKDILAGKEAPLARKAIYLPNGKKIEQHYRMLEKQQIYMFNPKI